MVIKNSVAQGSLKKICTLYFIHFIHLLHQQCLVIDINHGSPFRCTASAFLTTYRHNFQICRICLLFCSAWK
uniref:Putative ovule protein n=1 Tax=Solanum chacoense TaxID=4108 RepID=A0A0V0GND2_SOLCH